MFDRRLRCVLPLLLVVACGKPVEPTGKEDPLFTKASMAGAPAPEGPDRPLAADLAVEPVSMLVMFNRLQTPEKLQDALNKKPGQFSHLDLDKDNNPDPLTVAKKDRPDGHAFEIRARPATGEFVVATMVFDPEWTFLGHYSGAMGGAASTYGRPLPVATMTAPAPTPPAAPASTAASAPTAGSAPTGAPAAAIGDAPTAGAPAPGTPPSAAPTPGTPTAPVPIAGSAAAVPADSEKQPGL